MVADGVAKQRKLSAGSIRATSRIAKKRFKTVSSVFKGRGVAKERIVTGGSILATLDVAKKRGRSIGSVSGADGVAKERSITVCRIGAARGDATWRVRACRASDVAKES